MTSEQQKTFLLELLDALLRSWWTVVAGVCLGAAVGIVVLRSTPRMFEAHATIKADVDKLPAQFVQRTVSDDLEIRLTDLRRAVLGRDNLREVIVAEFRAQATPEQEEQLAREISRGVKMNFAKLTREVNVYYRDRTPDRAAAVTNMLAEFFVKENKEQRKESASELRQSLEGLTKDVEAELQQLQRELNELQVKHPHELDTQRLANEDAIRALQQKLDENRKSVAAAKRSLSVLEAEALQRRSGEHRPGAASPKQDEDRASDPRIVELQNEIDGLLRRFTENHPDVIKKRAEIERIREAASKAEIEQPETTPDSADSAQPPPGIDIWETRVQVARLEVERLEESGAELSGEIARYRGYLINTPIVQQRMNEITGRLQFVEEKHRENQRKIETLKSGEQLEKEDIANPFVITGFATPPSDPVSPDRKMFLIAGVAGGLLLFVGPLLARAVLAPKVMSEASLRTMSEIPILVAIPVIPTPEVARRRRAAVRKNFGLSFVAASVLVGVVALWQLQLL